MFARIVLSAVLAGAISGSVVGFAQLVAVVPLIRQAELYEQGVLTVKGSGADSSAPLTHVEHHHSTMSETGVGRALTTLIATVLSAIGYAFLLGALFGHAKTVDWKRGAIYGLAGFTVFQLAPALGMPPALPGAAEADLAQRQIWWLATVCATAGGLALCRFAFQRKNLTIALLGLGLAAAPHLIGAPQPRSNNSLIPMELARSFSFAALLTAALFWTVLGSVQGYLFGKLDKPSAPLLSHRDC